MHHSDTLNADPILTANEVANDLRCSKTQVYRLMKVMWQD
jgi:hypothetical protein